MSDVAHAFLDIDPDGKTIIRAINTESHGGHTLVPVLVSRRTVVRLADQLGLIILDPELIQEGDRGKDHRPGPGSQQEGVGPFCMHLRLVPPG